MRNEYIIKGPTGMGNIFGWFHEGLLPDGKYAIVADGEYANGGAGPSTVDGVAYQTRQEAEEAIAKRTRVL